MRRACSSVIVCLPCFSTRPSLTSNRSAKSAPSCDLDRAERRLLAEVADLDVFAHPAPDVAAADQEQVRVRPALRGWPRSTNTPLNGSGVVAASGSGTLPLSRSRNSDRNRVSRKIKPCGCSGSISPARFEMQNADPSTRVTTPSAAAEARARARRPRLRRHPATLSGGGLRSLPMRIADRRARLVPRPARGLRRHRARRRAAHRRPGRRRPRCHAVRGGGFDARKPSSSRRSTEPPDPRELGNPWYDAFHALASYLQCRRLRHRARPRGDHGAGVRRRCSTGKPPVVHTLHGPWTDPARAALRRHREARAPRRDQRGASRREPRRHVRGHSAQRHRLVDVSVPRRQGRLPHLHRARESRQGTGRGDPHRAPGRPAAEDDPQARRTAGTRVLRARDPSVARPRHRACSRTSRTQRRSNCSVAAKAMLFPIRWPEPFGLVMVEAMACGTPVVTTNWGAAPELVDDGVTGFRRDTPTTSPTRSPRSTASTRPRAGPGSRTTSRPRPWSAATRPSTTRVLSGSRIFTTPVVLLQWPLT